MILFIEKTWFLWWAVAILFILRWLHLFSFQSDEANDLPTSDQTKSAVITSGQLPAGRASGLSV